MFVYLVQMLDSFHHRFVSDRWEKGVRQINYFSVKSHCSLLEVDGELRTILYRLDNLVVCHILNDLVNRDSATEALSFRSR